MGPILKIVDSGPNALCIAVDSILGKTLQFGSELRPAASFQKKKSKKITFHFASYVD